MSEPKINITICKKVLERAKKSSHRFRLGCALVYKNRIVSFGHNQVKTHPKANNDYHTLHAEAAAIIGAGAGGKGTWAYVGRIKKNGSQGLAKPCLACTKMFIEHQIYDLWYSTDESNVWKYMDLRTITYKQLLETDVFDEKA